MSIKRRSEHSVTLYNPSKAYNGYTLFWTRGGTDVWLIDMQGYVVHHWKMPYPAGLHGVLLPNGNLLGSCRVRDAVELGLAAGFAGIGGLLLEMDWEGNPVWKHEAPYQGHDFYRLDNGNTLFNSWAPDGQVPRDIAARVKGGLPGTELRGVMWGDVIREVNPAGEEVWAWFAYQHLDPEIDIMCPLEERSLYPYINSVFSMPNEDILLSLRYLDTVAIIDKDTGDVKWRWGRGEIAHQHDASMLDNGNVLIFDNGAHRAGFSPTYSRVVEVNPTTGKIKWEYKSDPPTDFYTPVMGGCQRLPNGNTLICESLTGRIFEVTYEGEMAWEFVNPFYSFSDHHGWTNSIFRVHRYGLDYARLGERNLDPEKFEVVNRIYGPDAFTRGAI